MGVGHHDFRGSHLLQTGHHDYLVLSGDLISLFKIGVYGILNDKGQRRKETTWTTIGQVEGTLNFEMISISCTG